MPHAPQVVLFGSIAGGWREKHVIPVLAELGVTYYNPVQTDGWTHKSGDIEVEVMAACETVVMVFNTSSPAFSALSEAGWAALGCVQRGQHFIMQIELDYPFALDPAITLTEPGRDLEQTLRHWTI